MSLFVALDPSYPSGQRDLKNCDGQMRRRIRKLESTAVDFHFSEVNNKGSGDHLLSSYYISDNWQTH